MSLQSSINLVKREIKTWEHQFQQQNNRIPTKADVKDNDKVLNLYKAYKNLKHKQQGLPQHDKTTRQLHPGRQKHQQLHSQYSKEPLNSAFTESSIDIIRDISDNEINDEDSNLTEAQTMLNQNSNLGPTPQAGGKVLSIFDMKLTPPESSPLKNKSESLNQESTEPNNFEFKTPTKPSVINQGITPNKPSSSNASFMQRIANIAALKSPIRTPSHNNINNNMHSLIQTPSYLNRNISKFDFSKKNQSRSSPFVSGIESSPVENQDTSMDFPETPSRQTPTTFQVSPSPLKSQAFVNVGGNKRLLDVFQDHKNISISNEEMNEYEDEHLDENDENSVTALPSRQRSKTQKRTTRRWKIKPNVASQEDVLQIKNVHEVLEKINEKKESNLDRMIQGESNEQEQEEQEEADQVIANNSSNTGRKKIAPISHNYKRLKINKKGKGKFRRRR